MKIIKTEQSRHDVLSLLMLQWLTEVAPVSGVVVP